MALCTSCDRESPDGFAFCGFCGSVLQQSSSRQAEERKIVTVLFCDLVGFTARSEAADPEDVRATLGPYHAMLRREIERYGGTVEKFIGDAVMAVFGAPVVHEDDAERAVRAALRILAAIEELEDRQPELNGLAVRIGINSGEALVSLGAHPERGEGFVAGDVVNTASRLQTAAPVGSVVVGELAFRLTKGLFDYEALEPVMLKGKADPVSLWVTRASTSRFGVDVREESSTPFIGREEERSLLTGALRRCIRSASPQLVTIVGEPGVGKSRLVSELLGFVDEHDELISWRQGRCLPYGEGITFWALGEIVKAQAGILESDNSETAKSKIRRTVDALIDDQSEREWISRRLGTLVGVAPPTSGGVEQEESFAAWRSFLEALASTDPLVCVVEDLHWADDALLAFIEHLAEWASGVPILIVGTARPEFLEHHPSWAGGVRNALTIALDPLSDEETSLLVSALLSQSVLPAEIHAAVLERAGGNPLYAEEFVRMLRDRGILEQRGRSLVLTSDNIPFPEGIQALIAARLDTLDPARKSLLQDAAVVGKVFWAGAVAEMSERDERSVRDGLHELARKELVRPSRASSVAGQTEFAFWHLLVCDVVYSQIPRSARAAKHRAAAAWLEQLAGERLEDHAEVLAHHYGEALRLAEAAGAQSPPELVHAARRALMLAGDRAMRLDARRALTHFRACLPLVEEDSPEGAGLLVWVAKAEAELGHYTEADALLRRAIGAFDRSGDERKAAGTRLDLSQVAYDLAHFEEAKSLLKAAIRRLERLPPGEELARAAVEMAADQAVSGSPEESLRWANRAIELANELALEEHVQGALSFRGMARLRHGDQGGIEDMQEAVDLGCRLGIGRRTSIAYNNLAEDRYVLDGPAKSLEILREGIEFSERRGVAGVATLMRGSSCAALFDLGLWDELLDVADALLTDVGAPALGVKEALTRKALVQFHRGEALDGFRQVRDSLVDASRDSGMPDMLVTVGIAVAVSHQQANEPSACKEILSELVESDGTIGPYVARVSSSLFPVCLYVGEAELLERFVARIDGSSPRETLARQAATAQLAEYRGDVEGAEALYAETAPAWGEHGCIFDRAQALLGGGRCGVRLGHTDAVDSLNEAKGIFDRLSARPWVKQTDAYLSHLLAELS